MSSSQSNSVSRERHLRRVSRERQLIRVQKEGLELFKKKNKDYGDAFAKHGPVGVLIRMGDKISRLQSITKTGINLIKTEYSAMAIMLLDDAPSLKKIE